jgi:glycine hydroxymethyltransferase
MQQAMAEAFVKLGLRHRIRRHRQPPDADRPSQQKHNSGKDAENALVKADITVNIRTWFRSMISSPFVTSGIRVGTAAVTTRGFKEGDMEQIVDLIDQVISNPEDESNLEQVKQKVIALVSRFPLYK